MRVGLVRGGETCAVGARWGVNNATVMCCSHTPVLYHIQRLLQNVDFIQESPNIFKCPGNTSLSTFWLLSYLNMAGGKVWY